MPYHVYLYVGHKNTVLVRLNWELQSGLNQLNAEITLPSHQKRNVEPKFYCDSLIDSRRQFKQIV